jgi:hypothetical protein
MARERIIGYRRRAELGWQLLALATLAALAIVGALSYAHALESAARDPSAPVSLRVASAQRASRIVWWDSHVRVTLAIARADLLVSEGRVDDAYRLLLPLSGTVRDDGLFRETYQRVLSIKTPIDARKAHQQHAREKQGGALEEDDVIK